MDGGSQRSYLSEYLSEVVGPSMPIFPYDSPAAQWHGEVRAELESRGLK